MSGFLRRLMESGGLPPLAYYFARFVARGCGADEDGLLARSAALVSLRNLQGDVCVDLGEYTGRPLFGDVSEASPELFRAPTLGEWLDAHPEWRTQVINFSKGQLKQGLPARCITRDMDWGIPVPLPDDPDAKGKVLYVWFDAPIGYISSTIEWAREHGKDWRRLWIRKG